MICLVHKMTDRSVPMLRGHAPDPEWVAAIGKEPQKRRLQDEGSNIRISYL